MRDNRQVRLCSQGAKSSTTCTAKYCMVSKDYLQACRKAMEVCSQLCIFTKAIVIPEQRAPVRMFRVSTWQQILVRLLRPLYQYLVFILLGVSGESVGSVGLRPSVCALARLSAASKARSRLN